MSDDGQEVFSGEIADNRLRTTVEWDDDFVPTERQRFAWGVIAAQLRSRPGKWARIPDAQPTMTTLIRKGVVVAFREGRWQAATRYGQLYLRYLGPDSASIEGAADDGRS